MKQKIKNYFYEIRLLLRAVPAIVLSLFILSLLAMNLLANKSINLSLNWLALDCGILISWIAFLCMDILTKHFGPKAATQISIIAILINLCFCLIFYIASRIGGTWGAFYDFNELPIINDALDSTIGGTWYVLLGSTIAFIISAIVNNFSNYGIGKIFNKNKDSFIAYACRTYISTGISQFIDNLVFALLVSHFFFGWTITQCLMCAFTGMIVELICEIVFSPIGYKVINNWQKNNVGNEYLEYIKRRKEMGGK